MNTTLESDRLQKIVILNPKGGSGKTTLATNLAAWFAAAGDAPTLVDCDPGGFCMRWLEKRPAEKPRIHGIKAHDAGDSQTTGHRRKAWPESRHLIVDLPAALDANRLYDVSYDADSILIPVMPSDIDTYAASRFVAELLLNAQIDRRDRQLAVVANRVRSNTRSYRRLLKFLSSLKIPMVGTLRDSQNFVAAAASGLGVGELPAYRAKQDSDALAEVADWLERWPMRKLDAAANQQFQHVPGVSVLTPVPRLHRR